MTTIVLNQLIVDQLTSLQLSQSCSNTIVLAGYCARGRKRTKSRFRNDFGAAFIELQRKRQTCYKQLKKYYEGLQVTETIAQKKILQSAPVCLLLLLAPILCERKFVCDCSILQNISFYVKKAKSKTTRFVV